MKTVRFDSIAVDDEFESNVTHILYTKISANWARVRDRAGLQHCFSSSDLVLVVDESAEPTPREKYVADVIGLAQRVEGMTIVLANYSKRFKALDNNETAGAFIERAAGLDFDCAVRWGNSSYCVLPTTFDELMPRVLEPVAELDAAPFALPVHIRTTGHGWALVDGDGEPILSTVGPRNRNQVDYIAMCVNKHNDLVEKLDELRAFIDKSAERIDSVIERVTGTKEKTSVVHGVVIERPVTRNEHVMWFRTQEEAETRFTIDSQAPGNACSSVTRFEVKVPEGLSVAATTEAVCDAVYRGDHVPVEIRKAIGDEE
jgi:hypothetical protein